MCVNTFTVLQQFLIKLLIKSNETNCVEFKSIPVKFCEIDLCLFIRIF